MQAISKRNALTLGEFVVAVYDACGKRRAESIIRFAASAHVVAFAGNRYFMVPKTKS
jgi:hypothetical protein